MDLWSLVLAGGFGTVIVALHRCMFECGGGGEYGGAGLLVGFWVCWLVWDCRDL